MPNRHPNHGDWTHSVLCDWINHCNRDDIVSLFTKCFSQFWGNFYKGYSMPENTQQLPRQPKRPKYPFNSQDRPLFNLHNHELEMLLIAIERTTPEDMESVRPPFSMPTEEWLPLSKLRLTTMINTEKEMRRIGHAAL